jgi:hypothetical protein
MILSQFNLPPMVTACIPLSLRFISILSSYLHLVIPCSHFPNSFFARILCAHVSSVWSTCLACFINVNEITNNNINHLKGIPKEHMLWNQKYKWWYFQAFWTVSLLVIKLFALPRPSEDCLCWMVFALIMVSPKLCLRDHMSWVDFKPTNQVISDHSFSPRNLKFSWWPCSEVLLDKVRSIGRD